nr:glycosyltransferase family 2 protein [Mucilaginibacter flavidus]
MKISLITVVYNAENTISDCITSVLGQLYSNVEYIVIDGGSTDKTLNIIHSYKNRISHFISEPDRGIYDAMNKGIELATGDVIGILNADDFFADNMVLVSIADAFNKNRTDIVYGDLEYLNEKGDVLRKWRSSSFRRRNFEYGWMPAHPTFYCRRELFGRFGVYSLRFGTAADYELMLRFLYAGKLTAVYLDKVLVKMRTGGKSNQSLTSRLKGLFHDFRAMRHNRIFLPIFTIIMKPMRKIRQYI